VTIPRALERNVVAQFRVHERQGLILAGVVGCGKTTLVNRCLKSLSDTFQVITYTGDDTAFRARLRSDSSVIANDVRSRSQRRTLVFVDEVQKSEDVFDAIKIAFDETGTSFIVSGSNPAYLDTVAKRRLQRRAKFQGLLPLSLAEIHAAEGAFDLAETLATFRDLVLQQTTCVVPNLNLVTPKPRPEFFDRGGLPLSHLAHSSSAALEEIRKTVERGFEVMRHDTTNVSDVIRVALAELHSREFAYQGIFQKTGLRSRDTVNQVIVDLANHGYLLSKRPMFPGTSRRSYLAVHAYIDPGMVGYLTAEKAEGDVLGTRVEGYVHARLVDLLSQEPVRSELGYFKPYTVDINDKTKFGPGEIDFLIRIGKRLVPIEVKTSANLGSIETPVLDDFVHGFHLPFGIVLYGGAPYADAKRKRIYWPFWAI
jgi:predicted AAA+ superfamily ATPase